MTTPDGPRRPTTGKPATTGEVDDLAEVRRRLQGERERYLNAGDRLVGAQAEAAQARARIRELEHRLHVREAELTELRALVEHGPTPRAPAAPSDRAMARRLAGRVRAALADGRRRIGAR